MTAVLYCNCRRDSKGRVFFAYKEPIPCGASCYPFDKVAGERTGSAFCIPMTKEITLTNGMVALVDDCDYQELSVRKWRAKKNKRTFYAETSRKYEYPQMHRAIMRPPDGMQVDHINGDGLDNRRINLRVCTNQQNSFNSAKRGKGYKGVYSHCGKWQARIYKNLKQTHLGTYNTPEEAARAYDRGALKMFGEYAWLNFPLRGEPAQAGGQE